MGYDIYSITKLGKSIPKVYKSYLDFYNIKPEDIFPNGGTDVNSEFELRTTKKMRKDLKEKGYSDEKIEKWIYEFIHIEDILSDENKKAALKQFSELDKEFNDFYEKYKQNKNNNLNNQQIQNNIGKNISSVNLKQDNSVECCKKDTNRIINKINIKMQNESKYTLVKVLLKNS